ncbi:hypothetical protein D3C83_236940 [compost metagenome]
MRLCSPPAGSMLCLKEKKSFTVIVTQTSNTMPAADSSQFVTRTADRSDNFRYGRDAAASDRQ